jgi:hypothetical protein
MSIYDQMMQRYRQGGPQAPQVPMSPAQGMATQQPMGTGMQGGQGTGMQVPNSPMQPMQQPGMQDQDPALMAMLGIESLSPEAKALERRQATVDALRDLALGGGTGHWTGALAAGLAGYGAKRGADRIDRKSAKLGAKRTALMEKLGGGLFEK